MRSALAESGFDNAAGAERNNASWMQRALAESGFGRCGSVEEQCIEDAKGTYGKWLLWRIGTSTRMRFSLCSAEGGKEQWNRGRMNQVA